ncbi:MAG: asparagine synthase (glutamine-hydrolyzing) [Candidatus Muproteobacteria bacterium RBG_16_65_34]|uniref:asparagine synthase (glutamine-hydrolyzing) n=1 Tax=Candidatus Muproteobacteria bacterium RBG_16_65_34 TaxID=1817760 RepID=A0A1F6TRL9_9PROT|nr:MAG: asparagine synthase (glutamine-hydrolyzing) [Candidatus Muproteobacteria bacterium RBG_16_65_34]
MCGVAFLYQPAYTADQLTGAMRTALRHMAHRGPDDQGLWQNPPVAIGHRRLAIIDLGASRQPMHDSHGRFVLTYNGEVYNYKDLRRDLEQHWTFQTQGDTEVVLAGLATQGIGFLKKMEGMWAIALWDRTNRTLLLARDRMGKKPLYYQVLRDGIACASELPALSSLARSGWEEDLDSTADYLRYGAYLPGTTAYRDVREVLPGHVLQWDPSGMVRESAYWTLSLGGFSGSLDSARTELREKLVRAVQRRLVADVEVGAFLSGGIDSSLVVGILSNELSVQPKTFTIGFTDPAYDERQYANIVATRYRTDHYEETLSDWDSELLKKLILEHVGQPFADSSLLPTSFLARLASRHVKVALSGDGGDELFSGYQRYQGRALLRWYTRLPKIVRLNVERLIQRIPEPMAHHSRSLLKKAHLFYDVIKRQEAEQPYVAPTFYSNPFFAKLAPELAGRGHPPPRLPPETHEDSLLEMMAADALVYLPQDILVKVDRATMAYSLEARAPFLDRDVVELAFSLPRPWHRRGTRGKRMLRGAFADLLPRSVWQRRKQGFGVPIHQWFRDRLGNELEELLSTTISPLSTPHVRDMLHAHRLKARDHGYRLWGLYVYLLWKKRLPPAPQS